LLHKGKSTSYAFAEPKNLLLEAEEMISQCHTGFFVKKKIWGIFGSWPADFSSWVTILTHQTYQKKSYSNYGW
jgi:hypothetical protein